MRADNLLQKLDENIGVEATRDGHVAHMSLTTHCRNHVDAKPGSCLCDSRRIASSAPGCATVIVRAYAGFINKVDNCFLFFSQFAKGWIAYIQILLYFFFRSAARLFAPAAEELIPFS